MEESKKYTLNKADWASIGWGAFDVTAGALLTFVTDSVVPGMDFGAATPFVIMMTTTLSKALRKWLAERSIPEADKKK